MLADDTSKTTVTVTSPDSSMPPAILDAALVVDWSVAIQQANLHRVQRLLRSHPDLLWTPLTAWDPERDASHVIAQLKTVQHLGSSLDSLCALQYTLLQHSEAAPEDKTTLAQLQTANLLWFLIESATKQDLDNQCWGNCNNRTLHLVSFLGHQQVARRLLDDKNASTEIPNDLGFFARDVALSDNLAQLLSPSAEDMNDTADPKRSQQRNSTIPRYPSTDRFNHLRQLAETTGPSKGVNSTREAEGRYFRSGHVAESKRKVLSEEEAELEKQRLRRQQEVAMLAKRSAVKNNPLFKRFEQQQQQQRSNTVVKRPTASTATSQKSDDLSENNTGSVDKNNDAAESAPPPSDADDEPKKKRNSKVIAALRNKSIVSSSVFLQTEPERPVPRSPRASPPADNHLAPDDGDDQESKDEQQQPNESASVTDNVAQAQELSEEEAVRMDRHRLSGSQQAQWALGMNSWASIMDKARLDTVSSEEENASEGEQWFESQEFDLKNQDNKRTDTTVEDRLSPAATPLSADEATKQTVSHRPLSIESNEPLAHASYAASSLNNTTPSSSPSSSSLPSPTQESVLDNYPTPPSISPVSTITSLPVQQEEQQRHTDTVGNGITSSSSYGSISVSTTSRYVRRLSQAQNPALVEQQQRQQQLDASPSSDDANKQSKFKIKRVPVRMATAATRSSAKQHEGPTIRRSQSALQSLGNSVPASVALGQQQHLHQPKASRHGKLYLRINAATDMLLPIPTEPTYVRCVVSDDRYEYMSRYAQLGQHIPFEYECIIDTTDNPNSIITISLHVRPDLHLRSKIPLTRLFSTSKKHHHHDKSSLSTYVCHDDGSIGHSRFALSHMLHGCYMRSYSARFDCFNAWTQRHQKHRNHHRANDPDGDVLKVIGSLEIEMLYLPLSDPSMSVPRSLRDCDMAIKIQQWNETCWNTENLLASATTSSIAPEVPGSGLVKKLQPTRSPSLF